MMERLRILIVDDHPDSASVLSRLLELYGHDCRFATTPSRAIEIAHKNCADLAIIDLMMPEMNGFELLAELRKCPTLKKAFAVAYSANYHMEKQALEAGFDAFMRKPYQPGQLLELLETVHQEQESQ